MSAAQDAAGAFAVPNARLLSSARVGKLTCALHIAVGDVCATEPDLTWGEVVEAAAELAHRYAQHFNRHDNTPAADLLPAPAGEAP